MASPRGKGAGYRRIAAELAARIEAGEFPVGEMLPSIREISVSYDVSENIARDALAALRDQGVIEISPGIGSTVLAKPSEVEGESDALTQRLNEMQARLSELAETVAQQGQQIAGQAREIAQLRQQSATPAARPSH